MSVISFGPEFREAPAFGPKRERDGSPFIEIPVIGADGELKHVLISFDDVTGNEKTLLTVTDGDDADLSIQITLEDFCEALVGNLEMAMIYASRADMGSDERVPMSQRSSAVSVLGPPGTGKAYQFFDKVTRMFLGSTPCETAINLIISIAVMIIVWIGISPATSYLLKRTLASSLCQAGPVRESTRLFTKLPGYPMFNPNNASACTILNAAHDRLVPAVCTFFISTIFTPRSYLGGMLSRAGYDITKVHAKLSPADAVSELFSIGYVMISFNMHYESFFARISEALAVMVADKLRKFSTKQCIRLGYGADSVPKAAAPEASGGAGPSGVHKGGSGARQDGTGARSEEARSPTRRVASAATQRHPATASGYPGPWKRGPGGDFREVARYAYRNREEKIVDGNGYPV